ncbi:MAG: integral membrane sensor signal transduction histidine [Geobacteraceae bacterium]|nr:MAG: integral membrane sensor signal transduction histidine [Geobacteraceae bacterium]
MRSSIRWKFLLVLIIVAALGVSSSLILRKLIVRDFGQLTEGEMEDRVYWVSAALETAFEKNQEWNREALTGDAVWALLLGIEMRVKDRRGALVMDTARALKQLSPESLQRILSSAGINVTRSHGPYASYPLFLKGEEIGRLEVRYFPHEKRALFVSRTNRFLLISALLLGGVAILSSMILARRLTRPISRLARAADSISQGNLHERIEITGSDELATLAHSFNRMTQALEKQNALRKKVSANFAHEMRTPLAIMQGQLEGMLDGLIPIERRVLESLLEEDLRLARIVGNVEELVQAEASALTLKRIRLPLKPFLESIAQRFSDAAGKKNISFSVACDDEVRVNADLERLTQIFINLVTNAVKAIDSGGTIRLSGAAEPGCCRIDVTDTGRGITEADLPLIFERFYRKESDGLGLGLPIVRELVDAHGGAIEVASQPGEGSTFTVRLPDQENLHNSP